MRLLRRLEFACGLASLLFGGLAAAVAFATSSYAAEPSKNLQDFLMVGLIWILLPALAATASYAHGIKEKQWGVYLLGLCGLAALYLLYLFCTLILLAWVYPAWLAFVSTAPLLLVLLASILSLLASIK